MLQSHPEGSGPARALHTLPQALLCAFTARHGLIEPKAFSIV